MSKKYRAFKKLNLILLFSCICAANAHNESKMFFTTKADPADVLEWQLAASGNGQLPLSVRVWAELAGAKKQDGQKKPFTGSARVFGKAGQSFLVCAQSLDAEGFFQEAVATAAPAANVYLLRLGGTVGGLTIDQGQPCPELFGQQYPFVSGLSIRSENAFSVVAKRADTEKDKVQDNNDRMIPPLNLPAKLSSRLSLSGGGLSPDDHHAFKRPPFMPVLDKMMAQLLLLPILNLPANWRDYLPFAGLYHWFAGTGNPGVTLLIRFNNEPALRLDISQAEFRELAPILPDVPQLLHWLAPKLNGREHLAQQLAGLLAQKNKLMLPEPARAAIERQLAIILEQPDTEFSLEFEYSQLHRALRAQEQPPGAVELGGGISKMPGIFLGQGENQQASSGNPANRQGNQHSQWQASQNPSAPGNEIIIPDLVINLEPPEDYFTLIAHQTRYRINSQEVFLHLLDPISEAPLQLQCWDCIKLARFRVSEKVPLQELVNHAQSHQLTCAECGEFQPGAVSFKTRQARLDCHTRSHCQVFRASVPPMPAVDASLTILRLMLRFGTEETLIRLLPLITRQSMVAALGQTDQEGRTFVHDLARYSPDSVALAMVESLIWLGKAEHLEARDIDGKTPLSHMLLDRSQDFILKLGAYLDKQITHDDKTAIDLPGESGETDLIGTLMGDSHLHIIPPVSHSDSAWALLPDEILISIFSLLPLKDLASCRAVNKRAYNLIQGHDHHLVRDALWRHSSPPADLFSWDAWENSISRSLGTKQDDDPQSNEKNEQVVAQIEACKDHKSFHKILFHTLAKIKPRALWSFQSSGQMQGDSYLNWFAFSPNGRFLVTCRENRLVCINVWQGNSPGQEVFRERLHDRGKILKAFFSPDSRTLAAFQHSVTFILAAVENDKWQEVHRVQYRAFFNLAVFSPNSQALLVCTSENNFILTCQGNNSWVELAPLPLSEEILSACFTPDNQVLTVVMVDSIAQIQLFGNFELKVQQLQQHEGGGSSYASFSPDGRALAIAIDDHKNWHYMLQILTCQGADIKICQVKCNRFIHFSFSPDSQYLVIKSDNTARIFTHRGEGVWEEVYKVKMTDDIHNSAIFGPDSRSLITTSTFFFNSWSSSTVNIHLCNSSGIWKKVCKTRLPDDLHHYGYGSLSFSPDGLALIACLKDTLRIYRIILHIRELWGEF